MRFSLLCAIVFALAASVGLAIVVEARTSSLRQYWGAWNAFYTGARAWLDLALMMVLFALLAAEGASRRLVQGGLAAALTAVVLQGVWWADVMSTSPGQRTPQIMLVVGGSGDVAEMLAFSLLVLGCARRMTHSPRTRRGATVTAATLLGLYAPTAGARHLLPWGAANAPPLYLALGVILVGLAVGLGSLALLRVQRSARGRRGSWPLNDVALLTCPRCRNRIEVAPGVAATCPTCELDIALAVGLTRCAKCDYSLEGAVGDVCPECGATTGAARLRAVLDTVRAQPGEARHARSKPD